MVWHEGRTCEQYDQDANADPTQADTASMRFIQANTKSCPGRRGDRVTVCGSPILKDGGCSHMTCEDV